MNRWWGTATDAEKQAADRNSRAAQRTIRNLPAAALPAESSDEDNFDECDTSFQRIWDEFWWNVWWEFLYYWKSNHMNDHTSSRFNLIIYFTFSFDGNSTHWFEFVACNNCPSIFFNSTFKISKKIQNKVIFFIFHQYYKILVKSNRGNSECYSF